MKKLIKLVFKTNGDTYYFGTFAEIFRRFSQEEIGTSINNVWNIERLFGGKYENTLVKMSKVDSQRVIKVVLPYQEIIVPEDEISYWYSVKDDTGQDILIDSRDISFKSKK